MHKKLLPLFTNTIKVRRFSWAEIKEESKNMITLENLVNKDALQAGGN